MLLPLIYPSTVNELKPAHGEERRYKCGRSFRDKCNLKKHLYIHSGDRLYGCVVCNKSFNKQAYLKKQSHTHWRGAILLQCVQEIIR
jgi:hypothetical protein